jgi:curved DNA-binding protein CbpA
MATLYDMLGVHEDATNEELKRAYRRAAMKAHPDRNVGREAAAHARFQEIKEAYAILSDPDQRRIYDAVYAEEMQRIVRRREEEERLRAEREAAREAEYAAFVALAMRFAELGHNRDVMFGVLLGRDCEVQLAGRIADSVAALHASRQPGASCDGHGDDRAAQSEDEVVTQARSPEEVELASEQEADKMPEAAAEHVANSDVPRRDERAANLFSTLWHGMFGLRP